MLGTTRCPVGISTGTSAAGGARDAGKVGTRAKLSPIGTAVTQAALGDPARQARDAARATQSASAISASASRTDPKLNLLGDAGEAVGAAGMIVSVGAVVAETAQAPDGQKGNTAVRGGLTLGASYAGAELGALQGAAGGPWMALAGSL